MTEMHLPVLLEEVIAFLAVKPGGKYIDATLGGGGHAQAIIRRGGTILGIDQDPQAISLARQRLSPTQAKVVLGNFTDLETLARQQDFDLVAGILFDLGVASFQLDTAERGFSFQADAPLDMRMNPDLAVTAADLVNGLGRKELATLFTKLAQERLAAPIANAIVEFRRLRPITTTGQLAALVERVYRRRRGHLHPATKVFLGLRLAVNDELNSLKAALPQAINLLQPGGRLVVISFHAGEDRIVKQFFKTLSLAHQGTILTKKPVSPDWEEITANPRSRSAKLRALIKK
jgi:16S rRNA (cytosine1402-N4)-methyltransferase